MRIHLWPPTPLNQPGLSLAARGFPLARQHSSIAIKFNSGTQGSKSKSHCMPSCIPGQKKRGQVFQPTRMLASTSSPPPLNEENQKLIAPHCVTCKVAPTACKYRMGWVQASYGLNSVPASVNLYQNCIGRFALPCATPLNGWPQSALIGCLWW